MISWRTLSIVLCVLAVQAFAADVAVLHNGFTIRHERRQVIGTITRLYTSATTNDGYVDVPTEAIDHFEKDVSPAVASAAAAPSGNTLHIESPQKIGDVIAEVSDRHHLDPDFVSSVISAESGFNTRAVSPKGARGLMQLMPQTANELGVQNAFDPSANVEGGTRYLRELLERYNFDLVKALAAYNAGPHRVEQYRGVPPYYETRAYVARIIREYNRKKLAEQKAAAAATKVAARRKTNSPHPTAVAGEAASVEGAQAASR